MTLPSVAAFFVALLSVLHFVSFKLKEIERKKLAVEHDSAPGDATWAERNAKRKAAGPRHHPLYGRAVPTGLFYHSRRAEPKAIGR
jgi:hypothetical protein